MIPNIFKGFVLLAAGLTAAVLVMVGTCILIAGSVELIVFLDWSGVLLLVAGLLCAGVGLQIVTYIQDVVGRNL